MLRIQDVSLRLPNGTRLPLAKVTSAVEFCTASNAIRSATVTLRSEAWDTPLHVLLPLRTLCCGLRDVSVRVPRIGQFCLGVVFSPPASGLSSQASSCGTVKAATSVDEDCMLRDVTAGSCESIGRNVPFNL